MFAYIAYLLEYWVLLMLTCPVTKFLTKFVETNRALHSYHSTYNGTWSTQKLSAVNLVFAFFWYGLIQGSPENNPIIFGLTKQTLLKKTVDYRKVRGHDRLPPPSIYFGLHTISVPRLIIVIRRTLSQLRYQPYGMHAKIIYSPFIEP
jgi:hypothetical protein